MRGKARRRVTRTPTVTLSPLASRLSALRDKARRRGTRTPTVTLSTIGYRLSAIDYRLSAIGYRLSTIGYRLSAIGYRLSTIGYRLSIIAYRLWNAKPVCADQTGHLPLRTKRLSHPIEMMQAHQAIVIHVHAGNAAFAQESDFCRHLSGVIAIRRHRAHANGKVDAVIIIIIRSDQV